MSDGTTIYEIELSQQDYDNAVGLYNIANDALRLFLRDIQEQHNLLALAAAFRDYAGWTGKQLKPLIDKASSKEWRYSHHANAFDDAWIKHAIHLVEMYEGEHPDRASIVTFHSPDGRSFTFRLKWLAYDAYVDLPLPKIDRDTFRAAMAA